MRRAVWNVPGRAGGVRGTVAVGTGVSVGAGVAVGWLIWATAVSNAAVRAIFGSAVGAAAGWQEASRTASKPKVKSRRITL